MPKNTETIRVGKVFAKLMYDYRNIIQQKKKERVSITKASDTLAKDMNKYLNFRKYRKTTTRKKKKDSIF